MSELIFVGYTNGHQIAYGKESEGVFYPDTSNECYIPLYMLETHRHRIESTSDGEVVYSTELEQLRKERDELKAFVSSVAAADVQCEGVDVEFVGVCDITFISDVYQAKATELLIKLNQQGE